MGYQKAFIADSVLDPKEMTLRMSIFAAGVALAGAVSGAVGMITAFPIVWLVLIGTRFQ